MLSWKCANSSCWYVAAAGALRRHLHRCPETDGRSESVHGIACGAAYFAILAAAGQGTDAGKLDDQKRSQLRQQALAFLQTDLDLWSKHLQAGKPADRQSSRARFEHWQRDSVLASVRDAAALKKLSAEEQMAWHALWADVAELLKKADNAK